MLSQKNEKQQFQNHICRYFHICTRVAFVINCLFEKKVQSSQFFHLLLFKSFPFYAEINFFFNRKYTFVFDPLIWTYIKKTKRAEKMK